jgi:hypothetical protein
VGKRKAEEVVTMGFQTCKLDLVVWGRSQFKTLINKVEVSFFMAV